MNFFENITLRRNRSRRSESNHDESNNTTLNCTTSSMPEMSEDEENSQVKRLQDKIDELTSQLNSAHKEIEILSLENSSLKQNNEDLLKKNNVYKQIASSPVKHKSTTPKKTQSKKVHSQTDANIGNTVSTNPPEIDITSQSPATKEKLSVTNRQTETFRSQETEPIIKSSQNIKHKLCIVSANKNNKILSIAENTFKNCEICHYLLPGCGTVQLITDLEKKLTEYTINDFCIILIGEKDFYKTENYVDIIIKMREKLQKIQQTNVIICVPTFKLSDHSTLFNWRIETFNNLLHLDLQTFNYAMALDSNLDLCYDFTMFSKYSRKINDHGMQNVFYNLSVTIADYVLFSQQNSIADSQTSLMSQRCDFFL